MSILMFDHTVKRYLPAEKLLGREEIALVTASRASRKSGEGEEEREAAERRELSRRRLARGYEEGSGRSHQLEPALLAEQIMTSPVVTLGREATMGEARNLFRERRFRHVPILSATQRLAGILSDRDLLHHLVDPDLSPIRALVTERVFAASPDTEIREIARVLFEHHIGSMPVIDPQARLVGIITRSDILRTLVNRAPLELWV